MRANLYAVGRAEERLLREQIRTARTRIEFGELRVRNRRRVGEHQGDENSGPHRHPRRERVARLDDERDPQECSWRYQRHRVDGDSGQAEGRHHLFLFFSHLASFDSRRRVWFVRRGARRSRYGREHRGSKHEKCHFKIERFEMKNAMHLLKRQAVAYQAVIST